VPSAVGFRLPPEAGWGDEWLRCCHAACHMPSEQKPQEGCKQEQAPRPSPSPSPSPSPGSPRESFQVGLGLARSTSRSLSCLFLLELQGRSTLCTRQRYSKLLPSLCRILGIPSHVPPDPATSKGGFVPEQPSSGRRSDQRLLSFLGAVGWVPWDRGQGMSRI
jgi:hypothetical protein